MQTNFEKVKGFLLDMGIEITSENDEEELVVADNPELGIHYLEINDEYSDTTF